MSNSHFSHLTAEQAWRYVHAAGKDDDAIKKLLKELAQKARFELAGLSL